MHTGKQATLGSLEGIHPRVVHDSESARFLISIPSQHHFELSWLRQPPPLASREPPLGEAETATTTKETYRVRSQPIEVMSISDLGRPSTTCACSVEIGSNQMTGSTCRNWQSTTIKEGLVRQPDNIGNDVSRQKSSEGEVDDLSGVMRRVFVVSPFD